jgi:hypothetical protein
MTPRFICTGSIWSRLQDVRVADRSGDDMLLYGADNEFIGSADPREFEFFTCPVGFVAAEPGWTAIIWSGGCGEFPVCTQPVVGWIASPYRAHPVVPGAYNNLSETHGSDRGEEDCGWIAYRQDLLDRCRRDGRGKSIVARGTAELVNGRPIDDRGREFESLDEAFRDARIRWDAARNRIEGNEAQ